MDLMNTCVKGVAHIDVPSDICSPQLYSAM